MPRKKFTHKSNNASELKASNTDTEKVLNSVAKSHKGSEKVEDWHEIRIKKKHVRLARRTLVVVSAGVLALGIFLIAKAFTPAKKQPPVSNLTKSVFSQNIEAQKKKPQPPEITARSAIVVSVSNGKILYAKNPDLKLPPASTTKILTAYLAIKEFDLSEKVAVPQECTKVEGTRMGLVAKEIVNVESLIYGMLVSSAGDAACTLSTYKFSSGTFIAKMNFLTKELGLQHTNFENVIGLDAEDGNQVSTARDLYLMANTAMKNGVFRKIVGTKEITLYSSDWAHVHHLYSTNQMLFDTPGSLGIKTGTTPSAKEVLVYSYQKEDDELIIVVMGSVNRYQDTKALLNYSLTNFKDL